MTQPITSWQVQDGVLARRGQDEIGDPAKGFLEGWGYPTWQDEFATPGAPDPTKWNVRDRSTFGLLNDTSVIQSGQCSIDADGICHIKAEWLDDPIVTSTGPQGNPTNRWHKTGYMEHRRQEGGYIYTQQFGVWEYKVSIPMVTGTSLGTLGAIWLRNGSTGELDMTEGWGSGPADMPAVTNLHPAGLKPNTGTTTLTMHTQTSGGGNIKKAWTITPAVQDAWTTYRLTWTPDIFKFEVNGTEKINFTPDDPDLGYFWTDPAFTSPWHIRCNLHIGPSVDYWGCPDPANQGWTADPQDLQIEYIRMYKWEG